MHPGDLKSSLQIALDRLLEPIRKKFESKELKELTAKAYPKAPKSSKKNSVDGCIMVTRFTSLFA